MFRLDREIIRTEDAPTPVGPYSQAVKIGNLCFVSGQVALDPKTGERVPGGVEAETRRILENVEGILKAAGSGLDRVVKVTVFLRNMKDYPEMNRAYERFFSRDPPARTTVQAAPPRDFNVEIDVVAYISGGG
ncbi:MAG: Rid family detoxifying hydrolase [Candidatus Bathyarchaeia archaeon]